MTQSDHEVRDFAEWEVDEENVHETLESVLQVEQKIVSRHVRNNKVKQIQKKSSKKSVRDVGTERDSLYTNGEQAENQGID